MGFIWYVYCWCPLYQLQLFPVFSCHFSSKKVFHNLIALYSSWQPLAAATTRTGSIYCPLVTDRMLFSDSGKEGWTCAFTSLIQYTAVWAYPNLVISGQKSLITHKDLESEMLCPSLSRKPKMFITEPATGPPAGKKLIFGATSISFGKLSYEMWFHFHRTPWDEQSSGRRSHDASGVSTWFAEGGKEGKGQGKSLSSGEEWVRARSYKNPPAPNTFLSHPQYSGQEMKTMVQRPVDSNLCGKKLWGNCHPL